MNQLEFSKSHIQSKLQRSGAIETSQNIEARTRTLISLSPSGHRIDSIFPVLQNIIDNPREEDIDKLNYIIYEVNTWFFETDNIHLPIARKIQKMIGEAECALGCGSLLHP